MTANKFFPKIVKAILPFAPVVGVVSTCLLVASAVAQVAEPILNAGIGLQVSTECVLLVWSCEPLLFHSHNPHDDIHNVSRFLSFSSISLVDSSDIGYPNLLDSEKSNPVRWQLKLPWSHLPLVSSLPSYTLGITLPVSPRLWVSFGWHWLEVCWQLSGGTFPSRMVNKRIEEEGCLGNLPFDSGLGK